MHIVTNEIYKNYKAQIFDLCFNFESQGEIIVEGSRNTIKSYHLDNELVSIKFFQKPGLLKQIIYSFFKDSKAKRSFDYAHYLLKNNIETPFPIAYIEVRNVFGLLKNSFYICKQINYDFTMRELIHDPLFENRVKIIEQFTAFTYQLHEANVNFLDHSPGNTLIVKQDDNNYNFYLIDLNRMKFEMLNIEKRMDNFKKMWFSKKMLQTVAKKYAILSNQSEDKLLALLNLTSGDFKRKINKKKWIKRKINKK